jgi:hypothetical protein
MTSESRKPYNCKKIYAIRMDESRCVFFVRKSLLTTNNGGKQFCTRLVTMKLYVQRELTYVLELIRLERDWRALILPEPKTWFG